MRLQLAVLVLLSLQLSTALAEEVDLSPAYLAGTWSFGGSGECGRADYLLLRESGTLELGTGKTVGMTGFWELNNDAIVLHMLVAPRAGNTHPFYQDSYFYQYRTAQVLAARPDTIEVRVGSELVPGEQYTLTRCP